jgi:hypothetical protein
MKRKNQRAPYISFWSFFHPAFPMNRSMAELADLTILGDKTGRSLIHSSHGLHPFLLRLLTTAGNRNFDCIPINFLTFLPSSQTFLNYSYISEPVMKKTTPPPPVNFNADLQLRSMQFFFGLCVFLILELFRYHIMLRVVIVLLYYAMPINCLTVLL